MGTRPEIIKMAPVYQALKSRGRVQVSVLHTGQHEELAHGFYDFFDIKPEHALNLKRRSGSLANLSALLIEQISEVLEKEKPDAVLVHGDTTSALCAALSAFYLKIPVGHVEAGLRTHEFYDPFPEEKNREIIARLSTWAFSPTSLSTKHLQAEGIKEHRIHQVGNTIVDACLRTSAKLESYFKENPEKVPDFWAKLEKASSGRKLVLVTAHRRENWGEGIRSIAQAVRELLERRNDIVAVWPVHANPAVAETVKTELAKLKSDEARSRLFLTSPIDYAPLLACLKKSWLALTDSGGIQEEAAALDKPVLILRRSTERPELIDAHRGLLVGTDTSTIVRETEKLANDESAYRAMLSSANPFGDGKSGERIASIIEKDLLERKTAGADGR